MQKLENYIDGQLVAPLNNQYFENIDPSKGIPYSLIPNSDAADVDLAVKSAQAAFPLWKSLSKEKRSDYLIKIAECIERDLMSLALAESIDNGKPLSLALKVDIPRAAANFKFYATAILHDATEAYAMEDSAMNYTVRQPIGVAGCISPWNLPLYLFSWKIAPALASGCTVVAKPSEITPMTAYLLSKICLEVDLPKGVLNIVHGTGAKVGAAIVSHKNVPVISFTGGTKTGENIALTTAPLFKKLSLELGGKNPNIIFADCNYDKMLSTTLLSSFSNQGQICLCGSRIFIEASIYDKFKADFIQKTNALKVGPPLNDGSKIGAIVSKPHFEKILSYIELAKQEGGKIVAGGNAKTLAGDYQNGYYIEPTIIENLAYDCRTNQEEIFGPVVTITPFTSEEVLIKMANSTQYGLAATVWTENINKANSIALKLESGIVWVNCWLHRDLRTPFGGIKKSGVGREGGFEAIHFFTEQKNICIKIN